MTDTADERRAIEGRANDYASRLYPGASILDHEEDDFIRWVRAVEDYLEGYRAGVAAKIEGIVSIHAKQIADQARREERVRWMAVLSQHWLVGIDCDHEAKTDTARCACSRVAFPPRASVGEAVGAWLAHVTEQIEGAG